MSKKKTKDSIEGKPITSILVSNMDPPGLTNVAIAAFMAEIGDYFLWDTSFASHQNTQLTAQAIQAYWAEEGYLNAVVVGVPEEERDYLGLTPAFSHRAFFREKKDQKRSLFLLRQAKFLFYPSLTEQDLSSVSQAVLFQVPTLASLGDNPPKVSFTDRQKMHFFKEECVRDRVEALHFMEKHYLDESMFKK